MEKMLDAGTPATYTTGASDNHTRTHKSTAGLGLGRPSFWKFTVTTSEGEEVNSVILRIPPQSMEVTRPIRAQVSQDLGGNAVVVQDGLGIPKWTLSGTHGAGVNAAALIPGDAAARNIADKYGTLSAGLNARYALLDLFEDFAKANQGIVKADASPQKMLLTIYGGGPAEVPWDQWEIMPEEAPRDRRNNAQPLAWNWSLSFWGITHMAFSGLQANRSEFLAIDVTDADVEALESCSVALTKWDKFLALIKDAVAFVRTIKRLINTVRRFINEIIAGIKSAVDFAKSIVNLGLSIVQMVSSALTALKDAFVNAKDFWKGEVRAFRDALLSIRLLVGKTARAAARPAGSSNAARVYKSSTPGPSTSSAQASAPSVIVIKPGDTMQILAARHLGDPTQWQILAALNGLVYPYLDFSGPGGAADPALQGTGMNSPATTDPLYLTPITPVGLGARVLGVGDAMTLPLVGGAIAPLDPIGWDTDESGSATITRGQVNLSASLLRRLRCPAGWLPYHPRYGAGLQKYLGADLSVPTLLAIRQDVANSLMRDPRVIRVVSVAASLTADAVTVTAQVLTPLGQIEVAGNTNRSHLGLHPAAL